MLHKDRLLIRFSLRLSAYTRIRGMHAAAAPSHNEDTTYYIFKRGSEECLCSRTDGSRDKTRRSTIAGQQDEMIVDDNLALTVSMRI